MDVDHHNPPHPCPSIGPTVYDRRAVSFPEEEEKCLKSSSSIQTTNP